MGQRLALQTLLEETLGSEHVYFQPPESLKIAYPAVVYNRDKYFVNHSDNSPHLVVARYQVTLIYRDTDSKLPDKFAHLPMCSYQRHFVSDNLNHDVFDLYF